MTGAADPGSALHGPLHGVRVVEIAAIGPAPFCSMLLADMGADVIRVERKGERPRAGSGAGDVLQRGRRSIALDLKQPGAVGVVLSLIDRSDILVEGFRPGVMERLGLGPDTCLQRRPSIVYGRMTGWGQHGPLARSPGHDINYLALSGALHEMGTPDRPPTPPLNLIADFGGGAMPLAFGLVCALLEARGSGRGQVVDAAMSDGSALLMGMLYGYRSMGRWNNPRGRNFLDGGAHFYCTYECADGRWIAVGAIEPPFYEALLELCGVTGEPAFAAQWDPDSWPALKARLATVFIRSDRDAWCARPTAVDACVTPVLSMEEAPFHPHHVARDTFVEAGGVMQPAPAPRFSVNRARFPQPPVRPGEQGLEILGEFGYLQADIDRLRESGAL